MRPLSPTRVSLAPLSPITSPRSDTPLDRYRRRWAELPTFVSDPGQLFSRSNALLNICNTLGIVGAHVDALSRLCDAAYDATLRLRSDDPTPVPHLLSLINAARI